MLRPSPSKSAAAAASNAAPRGAAGRAPPRPTTTVMASLRGLSSSVARTTTTAQYYGGGEGAAPLRRPSNAAASTAAPTPAAPTPTPTRQRVPSISRQPQPVQQPQPRPMPMQMQQEPASRAFLARSDVVDKQVIARTSGRCLGVVDHMFIDSETYRVVSVELRAKGLAAAAGIAASAAAGAASSSSGSAPSLSTWGTRPPQQQRLPSTSMQQQQRQQRALQQQPTGTNLPLATLCQVGDVVLVHDERALSFPLLDDGGSSRGRGSSSYSSPRGPGARYSTTPPPRLVRLTGAEVVSADGSRALGRVRGYGFDPETGELLALRFDALGVPRIPEGAMVVTEVPISAVLSLDQSQQWGDANAPLTVVLRPGADEDGSIYLVSEGLFGKALEKLQDVLRSGTEGDEGFEEDDYYGEVEFGRRRRTITAASSAAAPSPSSSRGRSRVDPQFEAWREVHGKVFSRYYGLASVPRTRAELDRAMAAAAANPAAAASAPSPARQQQQQRSSSPEPRTRAALPPPSRGSFSDALRPADPGARERAFEPADAFEAPPMRRQRRSSSRPQAAPSQPLPSSWPAPPASAAEEAWREQPRQQGKQRSAPPRSRFEEGEEDAIAAAEARWGTPPPPARSSASAPSPSAAPSSPSPPPLASSKPRGIPIMPIRSPKPPGMVRDADGGFGSGGGKEKGREGTAAAAPAAAATPSPPPAAAATVVSELSFGAPVPKLAPAPAPAPVAEPADDGSDGSAWRK